MSEQEIDVKRLREVAEAATPGPWSDDRTEGNVWAPGNRERVAQTFARHYWQDTEHIATFDPPTVLALLDRLEAAEALARQWSERCDCEDDDGRDLQQIEDGHALREALGLTDDCACRECEWQRNPPEPMEPLSPEQEAEFIRKLREDDARAASALGAALDKAIASRKESK